MSSTSSIQPGDTSLGQVAPQSSSKELVDMNAFLTMFTTQLQYQDPTNPMESYELSAQLAQFSTVEMLSRINESILNEQAYLASINNAQMITLVGQEIKALGSEFSVSEGVASRGGYSLGADANVVVNIYDEKGNLVRRIDKGPQEAGDHTIEWDGCDDSGKVVEDGTYRFEVEALDSEGKPVFATTFVSGTVTSLRLTDGMTYLVLNGPDGVEVPISVVMEVMGTDTNADAQE